MSLVQEMAKAAFEQIRDMPYRVTEFVGDVATNCEFKGAMLMKELSALGLPMRGRVAEHRWEDLPIPPEIIRLYSARTGAEHFFLEVMDGADWRIVDPTMDTTLCGALGIPVLEWENASLPAIPCLRMYEPEEQALYMKERWHNPAYIDFYFTENARFLKELNHWMDGLRTGEN